MLEILQPLRPASLKDAVIERLEELILSGRVPIGEKLPSERALALQLGVSRPVVHEGLVELAARGLVSLKPRVGAQVNDYRRQGSLALLNSLTSYRRGALDPALLDGLLGLRRLLESETARLAARHRSDDDLRGLEEALAREARVDERDVRSLVDVDFDFHHRIALASGNPIYPMFIKSFEPAAKNLAEQFFAAKSVAPRVFGYHRQLVAAVASRDGDRAAAVMQEILCHGRDVLGEELGSPFASNGRAEER
jgi:GntR family transcriptional repressor for pyruvate dehydrogenase complex